MARMSNEDAWRDLMSKRDCPEWTLREFLHFVGWKRDEIDTILDEFYSYLHYLEIYPAPQRTKELFSQAIASRSS